MIETLKSLDERLFLNLNSFHSAFFDQVMWLFSDTIFWVPLYIWFLWMIYKKYPKYFWTVILAIVVMIAASDQICNVLKLSTLRLRPSHEPRFENVIHLVNGYKGGMYGFCSSHAANSFALAFFILVSLWRQKVIIAVALLYAIATSYSRIYLGVHYPGDVLVGALIGSSAGLVVAMAHTKIRDKSLKINTQ
jgi:undecaprenyl-diphosphatase